MSADNYCCVRKHEDGGFVVSMEFASDEDIPKVVTSGKSEYSSFEDALDAALEWELNDYFEYGLCIMVDKEDRR
jgi:hypothetical protein